MTPALLEAVERLERLARGAQRSGAVWLFPAASPDVILSLCAALREAKAQEWLPIESAPKGRTVLVGYYNRAGKWRTVRGHYYEPQTLELSDQYGGDEGDGFAPEGWYEEVENSETINFTDELPTHWQPLPPAPKDQP